MDQDINLVALCKGEEKYVFLYDDARATQVLQQLAKFASDPSLSFTWYDAAVLGQKVRKSLRTDAAHPAGGAHDGPHAGPAAKAPRPAVGTRLEPGEDSFDDLFGGGDTDDMTG